ncbi:MAG: hypothetical protein OXG71_00930, partial [Rhodospirillales bacterium]|nr:hypothetical protein [Rhodospirillales bacterium]
MTKLIGSLRTGTIVASLVGGCIVGLLGLFPQPDVDVRWDIPALRSGTYTPQAGMEAGTELVLIFVGSSNCGWSNVAELPELFSKIRGHVLLAAKERSTGFATLGVARD